MSNAKPRLRGVTVTTPGLTDPRLSRVRFFSAPAAEGGAAGDPPADPPKPAPPAEPQGDPADKPLGDAGKKALDAERDARKAAEKALADLRKEVEDSKKSAEEKAADDLKAAQSAAAESAARALRYEVAAEKGLDLKLAARLTGTTRDELAADADALMELFPKADPKPEPTKPVPTAGKTPAAPGNVPLKDQIAAAEKAGDRNLVTTLKAMQLGSN